MIRKIIAVCSILIYGAIPAQAAAPTLESQVQELAQIVRELKITVADQAREIAALKGAVPSTPAAKADAPAAGGARSGRWNPDIGVIADTVLTLDSPKADEEGADRIAVRELEVIFGSNVDPYSRLDVNLAISDFEAMSLEEAYLTRFGLPLDSTARIGRFLPKIGKAISVHRDALDTVDEPLVVQSWFGAEGLHKTGADITTPIELPWDVTHAATIGVFEGTAGEGGTAFGTRRRDPTIYAHLKNYVDLGDSTGLEVGVNYLTGSKDDDEEFDVYIAGLDGTLIHRLNSTQRLKLQSEGYFMERQDSFTETDDGTGTLIRTEFDDTLFGAYTLFDFRVDPQWAAGFRYDYVDLVDTMIVSPIDTDDGTSGNRQAYGGYLTFYQSEFARWRAQYTWVDLEDGREDNRVFIQGTFSIGEHKHKLN